MGKIQEPCSSRLRFMGWKVTTYLDLIKECRIIAFDRFWAITLPTCGVLVWIRKSDVSLEVSKARESLK